MSLVLWDDNLTDIRIIECFSVEKKKERKMTIKYSQLYSPGTSFDRASARLSKMEIFSIFICFLKVYSDNEM